MPWPAALASDDAPFSLRPPAARLILDADYVLYACGLLGTVEPDVALALALALGALKSLRYAAADKESTREAAATR